METMVRTGSLSTVVSARNHGYYNKRGKTSFPSRPSVVSAGNHGNDDKRGKTSHPSVVSAGNHGTDDKRRNLLQLMTEDDNWQTEAKSSLKSF